MAKRQDKRKSAQEQVKPQVGETWQHTASKKLARIEENFWGWILAAVIDDVDDCFQPMIWRSSTAAFLQSWTRVEDKP